MNNFMQVLKTGCSVQACTAAVVFKIVRFILNTCFMRQIHIAPWAIGLLLLTGSAQAEVKQKLRIQSATFYLNSATLASSAQVRLRPGEQDIVLTNVANNINTSSMIVNATKGVVVESTTFQNYNTVSDASLPRVKVLNELIDSITSTTRAFVVNKIDVLERQIALLDADKMQSSQNTNLSVAEIAKMMDLVAAKTEGLLNEKVRQELQLKQIDAGIARLREQIDDERKKGAVPGGQITITFYASEAVETEVTVTYLVASAGWVPVYDIMADALNKPVQLYYKANVYQNSSISWDNVRITLSTGNPAEGMQMPAMNPWHLALYRPAPTQQEISYRKTVQTREETIMRVPTQQTADLMSTTGGTYQQKRGEAISMSGARTSGTVYFIDGVQVRGATGIDQVQNGTYQSSVTEYTTVSDVGVNATFDIDLPYTLASDGKRHMVTIKKHQMPATYRYYAVPKLDKDAFLQAEITNWEGMNLLPGETNIFYEGNFVGQGYIDIRSTTDTMLLSLGRDKKVIVKRERDKQLRSVKMLGSKVRESFLYTITVRNTRKTAIDLVLLDQYPISNDKEIVVEDTEAADAEHNETSGALKWTLKPAPGETKKLSLAFTIRYPKDQYLAGLVAR